jgi:hypothetical protein
MANGVVTGLVKSVRETSFMLDDGNWYGVHPDSGLPVPQVGSFVAVGYWTKSSKHNGAWRTFRNVTAIRGTRERVDFKKTNRPLEDLVARIKFIEQAEEPEAAPDFDDDIPF